MSRTRRGAGTIRYDKARKCYFGRLSVVKDGVRYRPQVQAPTRAEAEAKLRRLAIGFQGTARVSRDKETIGGYLKAWLDAAKIASSTIARYRSLLRKLERLNPEFTGLRLYRLDDDGEMKVLGLYARLERNGESASTLRKVHTMLHSAFEDARHLRRLLRNACDLPKKAKPVYNAPARRSFEPGHEAAFLRAIAGDRFETLYLLALDSGMRQGELFALKWADVDLARGKIEVRRSVRDDNGTLTEGPTKTKVSRSIIVSQPTIKALMSLAPDPSNRAGLVFGDRAGGFMRRQNFTRREWQPLLATASQESGLSFDGFTFHVLRHTCATMLLNAGENIAEVSRRLGHSKISTTLDCYAHALRQNDDRPARRFEERLVGYLASPLRTQSKLGMQVGMQAPKRGVSGTPQKSPNPIWDGRKTKMPRARIELATPGFSDLCSTN